MCTELFGHCAKECNTEASSQGHLLPKKIADVFLTAKRSTMGQERTIDTKLEDHAMFKNDTDPDSELMAAEEPEWADEELAEEEPFPEELSYEFDSAPEGRASNYPAIAGYLLLALGLAYAVILLLAPPSLAGLTKSLAEIGLSPAHPILDSLVFWVMGRQRNQQPLDTTGIEDQLRLQFDDFVTKIPTSEGTGAGIEDVDRILMALQRQDEKVNNLTRATKMYGKPMVEITTQVSETANQLKDLSASLSELREQVGKIKELKESLDSAMQAPKLSVSDLQSGFDGLAKELSQSFEAGLLGTRKHLDASIEKLAASADRSPVTELENTLGSIQKEISGIATGIDQLRSRPAIAPQGAAPSMPAPTNPAPAPAKEEAKKAATTPPGGLAHSISGSRNATGKNVLGAIAKLKNMRK